MAKLDLTGRNRSRNMADAKAIENNPLFKALQEKNLNGNPSDTSTFEKEAEEQEEKIDANLKEVTGIQAAFRQIPVSSLVAAPAEWNNFSSVPLETKILMAESIHATGLQQPIVVRGMNEENTRFQILAGHTRVQIYSTLYDITNDKKYLTIDAKVYWYGEIDDNQAREIISDTNALQRGKLTPKDRAFCIHTKMQMLKKRTKRGEGDIMKKVAEQMNVKRSSVYYWQKLVGLSPEFESWFGDGNISLVSAAKIAGFSPEIQGEMWNKKDMLTNERIQKLRPAVSVDEFEDRFAAVLEEENREASFKINANIIEIEDVETYNIRVNNPPPDDTSPVLLYAPAKIIEEITKRYEKYIVSREI